MREGDGQGRGKIEEWQYGQLSRVDVLVCD